MEFIRDSTVFKEVGFQYDVCQIVATKLRVRLVKPNAEAEMRQS